MTEIVLLDPPADVRAECCAGLAARSEHGRGGTAKSVPFASRVCAGGPVTRDDLVDMLTHMAAIEGAMAQRGLGDQALNVAWKLWGGDAGREWAEGFVLRQAPLVAAVADEIVEVDVELPAWVQTLNQLAAAERELLARLHELMEAGVEFAVGRLRSKVVNSLSRPSAALRAACGGLTVRDELLAAMAAADGAAAAVQLVPGPILARVAPSIETDESLRQVFVQLSSRLRDLVAAHQAAVAAALAEGGVPEVLLSEARMLWAGDLASAADAATDELMGIVARTVRQVAERPTDGEIPVGRVPASLPFRLLSGAGGGDPGDLTRQDYVRVGAGDVLTSGVALGVTSLRAVGRASADGALHAAVAGTLTITDGPELDVVTRTTWRWGGSGVPFPPHVNLDGVSWESEPERESACRNSYKFPSTGTLYPGDHIGCSCSYEVALVVKQKRPGRARLETTDPELNAVTSPNTAVLPRRGTQAAAVPQAIIRPQAGTVVTQAQSSQITNMANQLRWISPGPGVINVADVFKGYEGNPLGHPLGQATRGKPVLNRIWLHAKQLPGTDVPMKVRHVDGIPFNVENSGKVTQLEYTLIHEWGHTADVDPAKTLAVFNKVKAGELRPPTKLPRAKDLWPSKYSQSNDAEMFAEAFTDWHIDSASAHPVTKLIAQEFGWKPSRLADFSAARR